ncbi:hypothetical protein ASG31_01430 [Chryseobacterium sp. Leaf404]|uniref:hypothetical protein n=1 Tax=unclassified Chryseobacterium TaxID=2593645 RepID=UPI0006F8A349|nr:hypothetical protein ASG31_01430 [Chryseobacterium sp. Leaf404]
MKKFTYLLLILFTWSLHAQNSIDKKLLQGCKQKFSKKKCISDEDDDKIAFYLDHCPNKFGVVKNNGCPFPDDDLDGIENQHDACPKVSGPFANNGCPWPDTDNDGILDKDDEYPLIPSNCDVIYAERKKQVEDFKKTYVVVPFEESAMKNIIDLVESKHILTESIAVVLYEYGHGSNDHGPCPKFFLNEKALFLYQKTWTLESLKYLQKKLNKNIFFLIKGPWNTSEFLTDQLFTEHVYSDNNFSNFDFIRQFPKTRINDKDAYYIPKSNSKVQSTFSEIEISSFWLDGNNYRIDDRKNRSYMHKSYELLDGKLVLKLYEWRIKDGYIKERFPK